MSRTTAGALLLASTLVAACDSSGPDAPLDLLTAGRWADAGFEVVEPEGTEPPDGFEVPEWWEFEADGFVTTKLGGDVRDPVPYTLSEDGQTIVVQGAIRIEVETLTRVRPRAPVLPLRPRAPRPARAGVAVGGRRASARATTGEALV